MRRRGFSLTEGLVMMGIVSISLALLLPAAQQYRQDARKMVCKNNLKMFGLALHNYHDTHGSFPPAFVSVPGTPGSGPRFGWQAMVLPYMDQAPLYNQLNFSSPLPDPKDRVMQQVIKSYRCPSDPTPAANPLRGGYGTSNYSGNYGHLPARLAPLGTSDFWPGAVESPMTSSGLFARNSRVGLRDITDGTSNTLMVAERGFSSGSAIWAGVTDSGHEDDAVTDGSHRSRPNAGLSSFSGNHSGGIHILLGDGSVRFIDNSIESRPGEEMGTWQKLCSKDDGMPIGEF